MTLMQRTAARTKSLCPFLFSVPGVKFRSGVFMISLCYLKSQMGVKELLNSRLYLSEEISSPFWKQWPPRSQRTFILWHE